MCFLMSFNWIHSSVIWPISLWCSQNRYESLSSRHLNRMRGLWKIALLLDLIEETSLRRIEGMNSSCWLSFRRLFNGIHLFFSIPLLFIRGFFLVLSVSSNKILLCRSLIPYRTPLEWCIYQCARGAYPEMLACTCLEKDWVECG